MSSRAVRSIVIPIVTFISGVIAQTLLQEWFADRDVVLIVMLVLIAAIVAVLLLLSYFSIAVEGGLESFKRTLTDVASSSGLRVEYVEDGDEGTSYIHARRLIDSAEKSLTFVDLWEPFEDYQTADATRTDERASFYDSIRRQVERHKGDRDIFHRRIVQIPSKLAADDHIPFEVDPPFRDYLSFVTEVQEHSPNSCRVKLAVEHIRAHFIMIDQRYIVMPILTVEGGRQHRHGALVFDDREGSLVKCFREIYQAIDSRARSLSPTEVRPRHSPSYRDGDV